MCNACGFFCCAIDTFEKCGCDHCPNSDCHDYDWMWEGADEYDPFDGFEAASKAAPRRLACEEVRHVQG